MIHATSLDEKNYLEKEQEKEWAAQKKYCDEKKTVFKPNHNEVATFFLKTNTIITFSDTRELYAYNFETGLYEKFQNQIIKKIQDVVGEQVNTAYVNEIIESIKRQTIIERSELKDDPWAIPIQNGWIHLTDFSEEENKFILHDYSPEKVFFVKHPITYLGNPLNTDHPQEYLFEKFLGEIVSNEEDRSLLLELLGYCFCREYRFQYLFILYGEGANGKSVYLNLLQELLGAENVANRTLQDLAEHRFALGDLHNKNACIIGDLPNGRIEDTGNIKQLTGGDYVTAEEKYKSSFKYKNHAKIIASCNEAPDSPDRSKGWFRRQMVIKFPNSFDGENENKNILKEITTEEEKSAALHYGLIAYKQAVELNSMIRKETIEEKKITYLLISNSPTAFAEEKLEYDDEGQLDKEEVYAAYRNYCKQHHVSPCLDREFFKKLYKHYDRRVYSTRNRDAEREGKRKYVLKGVSYNCS